MKLISLKIGSRFRSLHAGFSVSFLPEVGAEEHWWQFAPYCLAGLNGSGKSNVLEALAAIFYTVECQYLEGGMKAFRYDQEENPGGFQPEKGEPAAFELEYFIPVPQELVITTPNPGNVSWVGEVAHIKIAKEANQAPVVSWENRKAFDPVGEQQLIGAEVKMLLPKYIIGYSSGENEILSLPFFKLRFVQFDEYQEALIEQLPYAQPEARLIYLDSQFSQAITLCNFLFYNKTTLQPFEDAIGLEAIDEFRISIRCDEWLSAQGEILGSSSRETKDRINLIGLSVADDIIEKLKSCATASYCDYDDETGKAVQILDYWVNADTLKAFQLYFGSALELFQAFQILLTLNLYTASTSLKRELYRSNSLYVSETVPVLASDQRIMRFEEFRIRKKGVSDLLYQKSLSDGEHQLLHSIGLCLLFRNTNSLFLLDEPETHLNPDWRAKYISTLRNCLNPNDPESDRYMRELLITSHSPFIISDCRRDQVRVFYRNNDNNEIVCKLPKINTFGTSVNILTEEIFGKKESIPDLALERIEELRNMPMNTLEEIQAVKELSREMGESVEKVLLFRELILKEAELKKNA